VPFLNKSEKNVGGRLGCAGPMISQLHDETFGKIALRRVRKEGSLRY